jgi:hypothetical protein
MTDVLRVNNTVYSWNSTQFLIAGAPYTGILSVSYGQKRERKKVWGARRDGRPLGRTAGKYDPGPVKMTMLADTFDVMTTLLTVLGLGSYGDAEVPILIQIAEPGIPLPGSPPVLTTAISFATITDVEDTKQEGTDELVKEVTWDVMQILENGKSLQSIVRAIP